MIHASLFSGIGGFDLAADEMEWENLFHCEYNPFGQRVLKYYWPKAISYADIRTTDFTIHRGHVDVLSGGFPCQPYSIAGKRKGKDDERHLWPEMLRAIREIRPRYIVGENVRGLLSWNGGLVFDEVQSEMETQGYEVLPFLLPAAGVNAPHRRDRIWFIAYAAGHGYGNQFGKSGQQTKEKQRTEQRAERNEILGEWNGNDTERVGVTRTASNANSERRPDGYETYGQVSNIEKRIHNNRETNGLGGVEYASGTEWTPSWLSEAWPTIQPICRGNDGLPGQLDGITFSKWRIESLKGFGNAIVPQVALQIFKAIEQFDNLTNAPSYGQ